MDNAGKSDWCSSYAAGVLVHLFGKGRNYTELSLIESLLFWIPFVCFLSAFHNSVETSWNFLFISACLFARFLDYVALKQLSHLKKAWSSACNSLQSRRLVTFSLLLLNFSSSFWEWSWLAFLTALFCGSFILLWTCWAHPLLLTCSFIAFPGAGLISCLNPMLFFFSSAPIRPLQ